MLLPWFHQLGRCPVMRTCTARHLPPPASEIVDRFALTHTTASPAAVSAFGEAVEAIAGHRPNVAEALDRALQADPMLVTGHALKGFCGVVLARGETMVAARHALTAARARSALRMGKTLVHSDSTEYSRPILERAGMVQVSTTTPYHWTR